MRKHIQVFKGKGKKPWRYRIIAGNGEITEQSQGYTTKSHVMREVNKKSHMVIVDLSIPRFVKGKVSHSLRARNVP